MDEDADLGVAEPLGSPVELLGSLVRDGGVGEGGGGQQGEDAGEESEESGHASDNNLPPEEFHTFLP